MQCKRLGSEFRLSHCPSPLQFPIFLLLLLFFVLTSHPWIHFPIIYNFFFPVAFSHPQHVYGLCLLLISSLLSFSVLWLLSSLCLRLLQAQNHYTTTSSPLVCVFFLRWNIYKAQTIYLVGCTSIETMLEIQSLIIWAQNLDFRVPGYIFPPVGPVLKQPLTQTHARTHTEVAKGLTILAPTLFVPWFSLVSFTPLENTPWQSSAWQEEAPPLVWHRTNRKKEGRRAKKNGRGGTYYISDCPAQL